MRITHAKLIYKILLIIGSTLCVLIVWLMLTAAHDRFDIENKLNQLHNSFHSVQYYQELDLVQKSQRQMLSDALADLQHQLNIIAQLLPDTSSHMLASQIEQQQVQLNKLAGLNDDNVLQQHVRELKDASTAQIPLLTSLTEQISQQQAQNTWMDKRSLLLLVVVILLWSGLLYYRYRKLHQGVLLTEKVLSEAKQQQSCELPPLYKGQLAAESELSELLDYINMLVGRLDQVHTRFIEEAQVATIGNMVHGFSQSFEQPLRQAATHHRRLNTLLSKLCAGESSDEQIAHILAKSQQILLQLEHEIVKSYTVLEDFRQIANNHQFDVVTQFNFRQLVESVFKSHEDKMPKEHFHVAYEIPNTLSLQSSPAVFEQIIHHCISNSIQHGKLDDVPLNIVVSAMVVNEFVHLYFKDDGAGIDSDLLSILADPTAHTPQHATSLGLGSSIIHYLVTDKLKGELKIQSPAHGGTCIHIVLAKTEFDI